MRTNSDRLLEPFNPMCARPFILFVALVSPIALLIASCKGETDMKQTRIRPAAVAGSWYSDNATVLRKEMKGYLAQADTALSGVTVRAVIVPHAGYVYSGRCAANSFRQLQGRTIKRVFVLGPSHHMAVHGVCVADVDAFETPLGLVPVDTNVVGLLLKNALVNADPAPHRPEHSIEMELPFLQTVLPSFSLVPLIIGDVSPDQALAFGATLRGLMGPDDILVASTDFTHYGPAFGYAPFGRDAKDSLTKLDMGSVDLILKKDIPGIYKYAEKTGTTWDGVPVTAVMLAALPPGAQGKLLLYYKSGDAENDYEHSVSYVSLAFWDGPTGATTAPPAAAAVATAPADQPLTKEEKATLLKIARDTLVAHVGGKPLTDLKTYTLTPRLKEKAGAFVTLHKRGNLRGCIGYIEGIKPLADTVRENACNAATEDPRFSAVKPAELAEIDIEVSVMSPLRKAKSYQDVVPGVHGVVLKKGWHQGVFLPQVATETGWDRDTFLSHLSEDKAGLGPDDYKTADLYLFTADVFGEKQK